MHRSGSDALSLNRRPNRRPFYACCRNQNETVALFCKVNAKRWCLQAEPSPCGGTIKIKDLEDNFVSAMIYWVTNGLQKTAV